MKKFVSSIIILLACCASMVSCGDKKTLLFNGKNLDGWSFVLAPDSEVPASEVFGVNDGGHITATINGVLKNEATMIDCTEGRIALQSEGGPLEIRNLYIIPLKKK